jgi:hypothetical protein
MSGKKDIEINLKPFNMKKVPRESIIVLLGKRNTGKSVLVKDILYHKRDIPVGTVISHTDNLTHFYDKFIPGMFIHKKYSPEILTKIFDRQQKAIDKNWRNPNAFLLFDDCLSDSSSWSKDESIKEIFFNGRHFKILYILTMQSPMGLPPAMRTNIDYTFILKNNNFSDREKIYKNYAGMFPSMAFFEKVLDACTSDYNCLVIDNTSQSNKLEDQVFYYRGELHDDPKFKMCSPEIWATNNSMYTSTSRSAYTSSVSTHKGTKFTINKKPKK